MPHLLRARSLHHVMCDDCVTHVHFVLGLHCRLLSSPESVWRSMGGVGFMMIMIIKMFGSGEEFYSFQQLKHRLLLQLGLAKDFLHW